MRTFTKFSLRFAAYLLVLAYLCADLFLFEGPIQRRIRASDPDSTESLEKDRANGVVARVFNHRITREQLDYAIHERLWLEGKILSELSPTEKKLVTYAALGELIDHELIRVKVLVNTRELPVTEAEINQRLRRFEARFTSAADLDSALKSQGIRNRKALRARLAAHIQQEKYVALRVDPLVTVSDTEISDFYDAHKLDLASPALIRARHIFIATLDRNPGEVREILATALEDISSGKKTFAAIALALSDDSATKSNSGDLGWMSKSRLPADFADPVFALPLNKPRLIRTKIGWHIVEVTDRKPSRLRNMETTVPEIRAALAATKRKQAVNDFRVALRRFERGKIEIFHQRLAL